MEKCFNITADTTCHSGYGTVVANKMRNPGSRQNPGPNANISKGFTALPDGYISGSTMFSLKAGLVGYWWSSTINLPFPSETIYRYLTDTGNAGVFSIQAGGNDGNAFSVGTVKD